MKTVKEIIEEILAYMDSFGYPLSEWYVGITDNIQRRLHDEHGVPKENYWYIAIPAVSDSDARVVEKYFLEIMKTKGGGGGGKTVFVYAYLTSKNTVE